MFVQYLYTAADSKPHLMQPLAAKPDLRVAYNPVIKRKPGAVQNGSFVHFEAAQARRLAGGYCLVHKLVFL